MTSSFQAHADFLPVDKPFEQIVLVWCQVVAFQFLFLQFSCFLGLHIHGLKSKGSSSGHWETFHNWQACKVHLSKIKLNVGSPGWGSLKWSPTERHYFILNWVPMLIMDHQQYLSEIWCPFMTSNSCSIVLFIFLVLCYFVWFWKQKVLLVYFYAYRPVLIWTDP